MQMSLENKVVMKNKDKKKISRKRKYGLPYNGSKNKICEDILEVLPSGERLVDLFGGGGAITDCALTNYSHKWSKFLYNDINPLIIDLFSRGVNGEFNSSIFKPKWVSREDFNKYKDSDGYVKYVWSFGNNGDGYLFGRSLEDFKRNAHNFIVFGDEDGLKYLEEHYKDSYYWHIKDMYVPNDYVASRKYYVNMLLKIEAIRVCVEYGDTKVYDEYKDYSFEEFHKLSQKELCRCIDKYCPNIPKKNYKSAKKSGLSELKQLQRLQQLEQLQHLERLERLERLEQLERLEITNMSYTDYEYQDGDVVYCDIPYENTNCGSYNGFNHKEFYEWVNKQDYPIYLSEYDKGKVLWQKEQRVFNAKGGKRIETLYQL